MKLIVIDGKVRCHECFGYFEVKEINVKMGIPLCEECVEQNTGHGQ